MNNLILLKNRHRRVSFMSFVLALILLTLVFGLRPAGSVAGVYADDLSDQPFQALAESFVYGQWVEMGTGSASGGGISDDAGDSHLPSLAIGPDGTVIVAWEDWSSGDREIHARRWDGVSWVEMGSGSASGGGISDNSDSSAEPSLAIGPDSAAIVAWTDYTEGNWEVYVRNWDGVSWVEMGSGSASGGGISDNAEGSFSPSLAFGPDGEPIVAWEDWSDGDAEVYVRRWDGVSWVEMGSGSASGGGISNNGGRSDDPSLAVSPDGEPIVAWEDWSDGDAEVYVRRWDGSSWVEMGGGSASGGGISNNGGRSADPTLAIGPDGTPIVAWSDNTGSDNYEIHILRWDGVSWVELGSGSASDGGVSDNSGYSRNPSLAISPDGTPIIAWIDTSGGNDEIYVRWWDGASWVEMDSGSASGGGISDSAGASLEPSLAIGPDGTPIVSWDDHTTTDWETYVRRWQPSAERAALVALYTSTDGDNWLKNEGWLEESVHHCDWYGVTCTGDNSVRMLLLDSNGLDGPIPSELGNLGNLESLNLSGNQLSGSLPADLGNLNNLEWLQISGNKLSGPIPPEIGKLSNLQTLYAWQNQLSGTIPPELGNLNSLGRLYLNGNQLSGTIPEELGGLTALWHLDLEENELSGSIPLELGKLTKLQRLNLWGNDLSGQIPAELGNLALLEYLGLYENQLSGPLPVELSNLANLDELDVSDNILSGSIPAALADLENLRVLKLGGNQLSGSIPPALGKLTKLEEFYIFGNQLSGPVPPELGNLVNLKRLYAWHNQMSGSVPPELGNLQNLVGLYLSANQLSGPIPPELGNLANLEDFNLEQNQLSGSIPPELGSLAKLKRLNLYENQLSGSIPPELGNLTGLKGFNLRSNQLSGPIPAELENLTLVDYLDLHGNQLSCWETQSVLSWAKGVDSASWDYPDPGDQVCGELVRNGDFEDGKVAWRFYSNGTGYWQAKRGEAYHGERAAHVVLNKEGGNVQLYQSFVMLEPDQAYRLRFAARSSSGQDMRVYLHKHGSPYTNYGLNRKAKLETTWKSFSFDFTTRGFDETVYDARLRFWFAPFDSDNSSYDIDNVVLEKIANGDPPDQEPPGPVIPSPGPCTPDPDNELANPGFEDGKQQWHLFSNGSARFRTVSRDAYQCGQMARVIVFDPGSNTQLYQRGVSLQPQTAYRLQFYGKAAGSPQRIKLFVHKHGEPYRNYGLNGVEVTLPTDGAVFAIDFTTTNFTTAVDDARLRIWLARLPGAAELYLDDFVLTPLEEIDQAMQMEVDGQTAVGMVSGYFIDDDDTGRIAGAMVQHEIFLPFVQMQR